MAWTASCNPISEEEQPISTTILYIQIRIEQTAYIHADGISYTLGPRKSYLWDTRFAIMSLNASLLRLFGTHDNPVLCGSTNITSNELTAVINFSRLFKT